MATLFCILVLTLHKTVLYAFHRRILRLHEIKPATERVFCVRNRRAQPKGNAAVMMLPRVLMRARCRSKPQFALVRVNKEEGEPVLQSDRQSFIG